MFFLLVAAGYFLDRSIPEVQENINISVSDIVDSVEKIMEPVEQPDKIETPETSEKRITSGDWKATRRKEQMHYWARKSVQDLLLAKLDKYEEAIVKGLAAGKLPEEIAKDVVN